MNLSGIEETWLRPANIGEIRRSSCAIRKLKMQKNVVFFVNLHTN